MPELNMNVLNDKMHAVLAYLLDCDVTAIEYLTPEQWKVKLALKEARS